MMITFTRRRLRSIHEAIQEGQCITCPVAGDTWDDSELLAVAGTCLAELMCRREFERKETTDEPLRRDLHLPFPRLSARMTKALNYALTVASNITNWCVPFNEDKTYMIEIAYEGPQFQYARVRPGLDSASDDDDSVDDPV